MFETAELFSLKLFKRRKPSGANSFPKSVLIAVAILGGILCAVPLIFPSRWWAPLVWLSFIFFLDPINALRGWPSVTNDMARGDWRRPWSLLLAGLVCGALWEFWNYWALSKWTYTVPYLGSVKIFEMPVLGYLGFPPFTVECWALYIFCRSWLKGTPVNEDDAIWIEEK